MCMLRFLVPRLAGNFLAGLHSLFIGQNCKFEQRFTREFREYKTRNELHFTSVLSSECEYSADADSNCNFALRVATKLA